LIKKKTNRQTNKQTNKTKKEKTGVLIHLFNRKKSRKKREKEKENKRKINKERPCVCDFFLDRRLPNNLEGKKTLQLI